MGDAINQFMPESALPILKEQEDILSTLKKGTEEYKKQNALVKSIREEIIKNSKESDYYFAKRDARWAAEDKALIKLNNDYKTANLDRMKSDVEVFESFKKNKEEELKLIDESGKLWEDWQKSHEEDINNFAKRKESLDNAEFKRMSQMEQKKALVKKAEEKTAEAHKKTIEAQLKYDTEVDESEKEKARLALKTAEAYEKAAKSAEDAAKAEEKSLDDAQKKAEEQQKFWNKTDKEASGFAKAATKKALEVASAIGGPIQSAIDTVAGMQAPLMARLLGTDADFGRITGLISGNLMTSPVVKVQNVYENLSKMVEAGIADNLEQRAFLATVSDKIATTFDAFDSNLLRLIRLQQADITATRLGMEARLTEVLNANYLDTSYLNNMFDTVAGNILEASSQMGKETAMGFEYNVQKWLGSLYSLGLSQQAVSQISSGINLLGTGGAQALSGSPMQSLFAIGAMRGGADFGEMLSQGLDDSNINKLMKGVVEYLREIAQNSNNRVAKNVLGGIFGMSVADLTAFSNLSNDQINRMFGETQSGANLNWQAQSKLSSALGRMSIGERIQNVMSNVAFGAGQNVATNPALYGTLLAANMLEGVTGGIKLPHVGVLGNFLDTSALTVEGLLKTGVMGIGMIGSLIGALGAPLGGNLDLSSSKWASTITGSGTWFGGLKQGLDIGTSGAMKVGSGGDITGQSITEAQASAESSAKITGYDEKKEEKSANDIWNSLFEDRKPIVIELTEADLEKIEQRIIAGVKSADSESPISTVLKGSGDNGEGDSLMTRALRKIAENSSQPLNVELSGIDAGAFNGINLFNL